MTLAYGDKCQYDFEGKCHLKLKHTYKIKKSVKRQKHHFFRITLFNHFILVQRYKLIDPFNVFRIKKCSLLICGQKFLF